MAVGVGRTASHPVVLAACALGRASRSAVARGDCARPWARGQMGLALQRHRAAPRRRDATLLAAVRAVRPRRRVGRRAHVCGAVDRGAISCSTDEARGLHAMVLASEQHAGAICRSLRSGVLSASADILAALLVGRLHRNGDNSSHRWRRLRAGVDHHLSHPVPALRRSARAGAALASRCIATATAWRRLCATAARGEAIAGRLGRPCRHQPARSRRVPGGRSPGHPVQRTTLQPVADAPRRAATPGRWRRHAGARGA